MGRHSGRNRAAEEEEEGESVFVSMTDMMVSFLFIVLVLLAFFISHYNEKTSVPRAIYEELAAQNRALEAENKQLRAELEELKKPNPLEQYMRQAAHERVVFLERLRDRIKSAYPDLPVDVIPGEGTLRFQGEGLFDTDSYTLTETKRKIVEALAQNLQNLLPCYSFSKDKDGALSAAGWNSSCNASFAVIEAVQLEGHTDNTGDDLHNLNLSANRAVSTFTAMTKAAPDLLARFNLRGQPLLSVAGYGKMRPVRPNDSKQGRAENRRIDLRIIMYMPASVNEIAKIREHFSGKMPFAETKGG